MSTNPTNRQNNGSFRRGGKRRVIGASAAGLALIAVGVLAWANWNAPGRGQTDQAVFAVQHGPLTISVTESGTIQNRDLVVVKSELEGKAVLLSLIPEGTTVEKGQLLAELDSSRLVDDKVQQAITVMNAEAAFIRARENLAMTKSQSESDISRAQLDYNFAQMDVRKYLEGDYPQELRQADADITIAKEELQRANDQLGWSKTLAEEKFITRTELEADKLAVTRRELDLKLAEAKLALLKEYTYNRRVEELKSNVEQTKAALDRVTRKGTADVVQAEADLKAKESEFNRQTATLEKLGQQIDKCKIYAPVAGMVVYATTGKASFRGSAEPLAEGQEIRERQELINLPTTASMMAEVKIHESSLRKIKKDQPVRVTVDAVPGKTFPGRVGKIGLLPDAQSAWMNPDLKVYETEIYLDGDAKELRAGMTCKAEIVVATYPDAIFVPVWSVVRVQGKPTVYLPGTEGPKPREVEIGLDNNNMVHVLQGLSPGELVLLAPPLGPSTAPIREEEPKPVAPSAPSAPAAPSANAGTGVPKRDESRLGILDAAESTPPPAFDPAKLRSMSREERQKMMESLTPEQRDALRRQMGQGRRGPRSGAGNPTPEGQ